MFAHKKVILAIILFTLLILVCISYAQFPGKDAADQQAVPSNSSNITPVCKFYGYWDHLNAPDEFSGHVNAGKSFNAYSASEISDQGLKAVVSISHILKKGETEQQWRTKLRNQGQAIRKLNSSDVVYVLLHDEPWIKGFTLQEQVRMVSLAREIIGEEYMYGFTFSRAQVQFRDRPIPNNIDVTGINFYPFFEPEYAPNIAVETREEFNSELQRTLRIFREKSPDGTEIMLTGQGFYQEGRWAMPPLDAPQWYVEAIQSEDDIIGLLWWVWRSGGRTTGTQDLPELFDAQKQAFEWMCGDHVQAVRSFLQDEPEPEPGTKMITVIESSPGDGNWYAGVNGVLRLGDRWRIYFQDRSDSNQVVYTESKDLQTWSDPEPVRTSKNIYFVQHEGQIYAYAEDNEGMHFWRSDDGDDHYEHIKRGFEWKLDTAFTLYFHQINDEPRMFGRVRGAGPQNQGSWGNDRPEIPRRGISYHKTNSTLSGTWENRILADPLDYFDYSGDLRPDFYQPSFRPDGTGEIVMFFRDRNNVYCYSTNDCRWTGPIYPVPAKYEGGEIEILSLEPAIDISPFVEETLSYDGIDIVHPGQVYIHPVKIDHNGQTWRVISRRSDEHYRREADDVSGVYLVREGVN